ncbi:capsular polysaccharide transport system ATP-binding protein [Gemmobacter caeni]|jgi:capsular polysaccharide transport system ATP-binding protein|uniref:ABC transporter ATP-binding protein n=1 Tax=Gemmobacter caeni TaxID=589035 RepID=UPI0011A24E39|nr:ABC transporter ATP-binding protein [Gemmobacter caeni]TWI93949.1 capsular polysaccharide transport system ATP-binding protein [Gemmobacter caeni]
MIRFVNLCKSYSLGHSRKVIVDNLTLTLPPGKSLALLGRNGAGKSTLLRMVAGSIQPDSGRILSDGTISWPVGLGGSLHKEMTGAQNVRFLARVYGVDTEELEDFVADFAELGSHFHMPVRSYSSGMKSRLAFGASMGIRFDTYLVDEVTAVGDARFRKKSRTVFRDRMAQSGAILVAHDLNALRDYCDAGLILENGRLYVFDDLDEAITVHKRLMEV